jgi:hypothetical protein
MAVNLKWELATDTNATLRDSIGEENISFHVLDSNQPDLAALFLNDVTIRSLAHFLYETGMPQIDNVTPYGTWNLLYDPTNDAVIIKWDGDVVHTISLD